MEGPTPISALIHAATMVAAGIFLGIITLLLGATLALAQGDIKRSLAYSTVSQLGYIMLAPGIGSYRAALFHLITHAYSKALLFLGSGSIIHSMEPVVGYSPDKSQNMVLMGGLKKYVPVTRITFLLGTLSLCGIPPLACFWSKDEILTDSWLYSTIFAIIAYFTAGLTAFYMFRVYLLTFDGCLRVHFQNYSSTKRSLFCSMSVSVWGREPLKIDNQNLPFLILKRNIKNKVFFFSFFSKGTYKNQIYNNVINRMQYFRTYFQNKYTYMYPHESENTEFLFDQGVIDFDILSKWLTTLTNPFQKNSVDWYEFLTNAIFSVSVSLFGLFIASIFYGSVYSSFQNLNLINFFVKRGPRKILLDQIKNVIYNWSYNRGYIDIFYTRGLTMSIRRLSKLIQFFDRYIIDGITNGIGVASFFLGEGIRYIGGGRISSYLFLYLSYVSIFLIFSQYFNFDFAIQYIHKLVFLILVKFFLFFQKK
ncbi:NAD(P)H-quinone oxidoreductase subunit 5 [Dioscorea sansibarensis]